MFRELVGIPWCRGAQSVCRSLKCVMESQRSGPRVILGAGICDKSRCRRNPSWAECKQTVSTVELLALGRFSAVRESEFGKVD